MTVRSMILALTLNLVSVALFGAMMIVTLPMTGSVLAVEMQSRGPSWAPLPPRGKGDQCVADTDYMRRFHMLELNHKRDETVHEGIRTKKFSLKKCITCHAVKGDDGQFVKVSDPKHFCRVCHDYAAVRMDCFDCHASRPAIKSSASLPKDHGKYAGSARSSGDMAALRNYLAGAKKR